jgi:hypothetical protein
LEIGSRETVGLNYEDLVRIAQCADLLINVSGMLRDEKLFPLIPRRVYLDLDPAFNQLWSEVLGIDMRFEGHTHFATIGRAIGELGCPVPTCGLTWLKTWPPVVLDRWPVAREITYNALTTIANWRAYGSIEHEGVLYGQKVHSLRALYSSPTLTSEKFSLALSIHPEEKPDLAALEHNRWTLLDPIKLTSRPEDYQKFVQGSKAEFGLTKSGYVLSKCGWFSDRSVCYLASGRPVIAQETGFSQYLPLGHGLFTFRQTEDLLTAIECLNSDYFGHAVEARAMAEEFFESGKVLRRLLDLVGL